MLPLDILTLHKNQFYYALSRGVSHSAYIIMPDATHSFNKNVYSLDAYIKKNNLIVTEVTGNMLDNYCSVDDYLKKEWGLACYGGGTTVGISESLYTLKPLDKSEG